MSIGYEDDHGKTVAGQMPMRLATMMAINGIMAAIVLFSWTLVAYLAKAPLEWATWNSIYRGPGLQGLLEYPFMVLWLWPLAGIAGSWLAYKSGRKPLAYSFSALPIVMMCLIFGMYYLAPPDWR